jgi:hypothetical protein
LLVQVKKYEMGGHVERMRIATYKMLAGKPEEKRPPGRYRHRWEDNIRMYVRDIGWEGVEWMDLAKDRD